jgi:hypothetical protein
MFWHGRLGRASYLVVKFRRPVWPYIAGMATRWAIKLDVCLVWWNIMITIVRERAMVAYEKTYGENTRRFDDGPEANKDRSSYHQV